MARTIKINNRARETVIQVKATLVMIRVMEYRTTGEDANNYGLLSPPGSIRGNVKRSE